MSATSYTPLPDRALASPTAHISPIGPRPRAGWNAYNANLKKLKQMQGKILWLRAQLQQAEVQKAIEDYEEQKSVCKELKTQRKKAEEHEKPL